MTIVLFGAVGTLISFGIISLGTFSIFIHSTVSEVPLSDDYSSSIILYLRISVLMILCSGVNIQASRNSYLYSFLLMH